MCHHIFMYDGRDKTINSQTNSSTKYIYFRVYVLEYLIDEKEREIQNYNY